MNNMALSDVSFDSGLSKHKFGRTNIRYSPDGRLMADDTTLSLPRPRSYGAARDYSGYPRQPRSDPGYQERRERARQAFYEYHGAYPSYESQSVQRQPPIAPTSTNLSQGDRRRDLRPERRERQYQKRQQTQGRPWGQGNYASNTGFDSPQMNTYYGYPSRGRERERERERSPVRNGYDRAYGYGAGYGTSNQGYVSGYGSGGDNSSYPGYNAQAPRVPTMDQRRPLPRDPYLSYSQNKPEWHAPVAGDSYSYDKTGLIAYRNRHGQYGRLGRWYQRRRDGPWSVLFLTIGMFLLLFGLVNVLICIDYHAYCRFWAGFIILEFGIFGLLHSGDWKTGWKNYCYVAFGVLSVLAAFASTALISEKFIPQIKLLSDLDNNTAYVETQKARDDPRVSVDSDSWVWICFGFDLASIVLFIVSYFAAHAAASCANRFYDMNWKCTQACEPYGKPRCNNPFGQILLGEVMAFFGIVARYGCEAYLDDTEWYKFWSPVWAGALTSIAGSVAAGAAKRSDNTGLVLLAIFLEMLAGAAAVVAVVFCLIGLTDNAKTVRDVTSLTSTREDHFIASACLYGVAAFVCFVQVLYSVGVLVGLFSSLLGGRPRYYGQGESVRSFDSRSQTTLTTQMDRYGGGRYDRRPEYPTNYWQRR